jgi:hypothetical protein
MESPRSEDFPVHDIWSEFSQVLDKLDDWEQQYRLDTTGPLYWFEDSRIVEDRHSTSTNNYGTCLWFQNILIANAFTYLWAFQIICIVHKERIRSQFPVRSQNASIMETKAPARAPHPSAHELSIIIFQSIEYLLQGETRLYGPYIFLFPFKVAQELFKLCPSDGDQMDWCQRIVERFTARGFDVGNFTFKI